MVRDATQLAERIRRLDKESKIQAICRLMTEYGISTGELISYTEKYGVVSTDAQRLREINQVRKKARKLAAAQEKNLTNARKVLKAKRERQKSIAKPDEEVNIVLDKMEF